jgi:hypothetical protein
MDVKRMVCEFICLTVGLVVEHYEHTNLQILQKIGIFLLAE